jgi:hypothetical protein
MTDVIQRRHYSGPRRWRKIGSAETDADGKRIVVGIWSTECKSCGRNFEIAVLKSDALDERFGLLVCWECRPRPTPRRRRALRQLELFAQ